MLVFTFEFFQEEEEDIKLILFMNYYYKLYSLSILF